MILILIETLDFGWVQMKGVKLMRPSLESMLIKILEKVSLPNHSLSLIEENRLDSLQIQKEEIRLILKVREEEKDDIPILQETIQKALQENLPFPENLKKMICIFTHHHPQKISSHEQKGLQSSIHSIIAVASCKGGVGKSTTAVQMAVSLAQRGWRVGLLDADIHGPSLPLMMGISEKPQVREDKKLIPLKSHGVFCLSLGFLVAPEGAIAWRGPMIQSAIRQLLHDAAWGDLDLLILDMPPGTGDAALSVAQTATLDGVILVSTPQEIALSDVRRGFSFFQKLSVPVIGMIETMSFFQCPHCGHTTNIFGHGGASQQSQEWNVPFWGSIPLDVHIRERGDTGNPKGSQLSPGLQAYEQATSCLEAWLKKTNFLS